MEAGGDAVDQRDDVGPQQRMWRWTAKVNTARGNRDIVNRSIKQTLCQYNYWQQQQ